VSKKDRALVIAAVVLSALVLASCFLVPALLSRDEGGGAGENRGQASTRQERQEEEYAGEREWLEGNQAFRNALDAVMRDYVQQPDEDALVAAAARGIHRLRQQGASEQVLTERGVTTLIDALDDPFSDFMDQKELKMMDAQLTGSFFGVGISMTQSRNEIRVEKVLEGTPAEAAGIQPGDVVLKVDGTEVSGMELTDVVMMIRGQEGTSVTLAVKRGGVPGEMLFTMQRAQIKLPVVTTEMRPGNIGYLLLTDWTKDSSDLIKQSLEELKGKGARGLILDLRTNPGGLMDPAINAADLFLDGGVIVSSRGRMGGTTRTYNANPGNSWDLPVVILTGRSTASSSEIFSAALHDNQRAVLVGETTFGKGSIQNILRQPGGTALRITVALYYTPEGISINDEGIDPDVPVRNPVVGKEDLQLQEAERVVAAMMEGRSWK
jgi:carboxyl-terminal processing protease